jgi:F-type H+-transporting ATPase subunit delta
MAEISTVARPYAQAAFAVAQTEQTLDQWSAFLSRAAQVATHSDMAQSIANPRIDKTQLQSVLQVASGANGVAQNGFLSLLVDESRVAALPAIAIDFEARKNAYQAIAPAQIVSAYAMDEWQAQQLVASLEQKFAKKLKPIFSVDASLIGGFQVTVGDELLDMSVRAKLARMQSALTI